MNKVDLQLFRASLRAISNELSKLNEEVPKKVYDELSAMDNVIERNLKNAT